MSLIGIITRMVKSTGVVLYLGLLCSFTLAELTITRPPKNATVLEHKRFSLNCETSGPNKPRIKWFHNEMEMPRHGINYRIHNSGSIRFRGVRVMDAGIYQCKAQQGKQTVSSDLAYLKVEAKVVFIRTTPSDGEVTIKYNNSVYLTCKSAGIPGPSMQWRKDGESIIDEAQAGVKIREDKESDGTVLTSVLFTGLLTQTTKFECESLNQHVEGVTVVSKVFTVFVQPDRDTSKRTSGICFKYNGTRCASVLGTSSVYLNLSRPAPFEYQERMATELLDLMMGVETTTAIRERCNGNDEKLICNYFFPPCENYLDPNPVPLCRESCTAVQDLLCYVQWPVMLGYDSQAKLPTCDQTLPSKHNQSAVCTQAGLFNRSENQVTSDCYVDSGRWYNGTQNVTKSGKPCQHWSLNKPQKHKRPPHVYRELENSENYCRNAGAEEGSPWCYIDTEVLGERWELCDIPSCHIEEEDELIRELSSMSLPTILIITIVGSVGVFIVALIAVLCFHFVSHRRQVVKYKNTPQDDLEIDIQKLPANMSYHCVDEPVRLNPKLEAYEYPRNDIIYIRDIGQGAFGRVFKAKAPNLTKGDEEQLIAVKMLKEDASDDLQADFEREASLMAEFGHPNIVKFLGVCAIGKPMCLLFEYMSKGDLNDYLRMCSPEQYIMRRHNNLDIYSQDVTSIETLDQLAITQQIAAGMVYLSEKNYVHRDLATRNCLVSDNLTVKISDFGLARSVHRLEYYKGSDNDAIPIRWMPLESILYNKFSVESDVWSFGVILWEIFSFALQPYYGMTHEEVVEFLKEGKNLVCPEMAPSQVYELMLKCWNRKPSQRPKFQALHKVVSSLYEEYLKKKLKESSIV